MIEPERTGDTEARVSSELSVMTLVEKIDALLTRLDRLEGKINTALALACPVCAPAVVAAAHPEVVPTKQQIIDDVTRSFKNGAHD